MTLLSFLESIAVKRPLLCALFAVVFGEMGFLITSTLFPHAIAEEWADIFSLKMACLLTALYYAGSAHSLRQQILAASVGLWAVRLGGHLALRIVLGFRDKRLDPVRTFPGALKLWIAHSVWVYTVLAPVWTGMGLDSAPHLTGLDYLGIALFVSGFLLESIADGQKLRFYSKRKENSKKLNKSPYCNQGLFRHCRFPNYFGELCVWSGLSILPLSNSPLSPGAVVMLPLSPITTYMLFAKLSIPLAHKAMKERLSPDQYQQWKSKSLLVPWPFH